MNNFVVEVWKKFDLDTDLVYYRTIFLQIMYCYCAAIVFCDAVCYVLKTLRFGTLPLCAATFSNITSCEVYVLLRYVM
jgi:hypothetical protein